MERAYDHSEFLEQVEVYLAGGLAGAEREAFEVHAAACPACAAALAEAAAQDASLRELFAGARPPEDLEDRLVDGLRRARPAVPLIHPMVRRAATGVAAALLLGGFGYVASNAINSGGLPTPWARNGTRSVALARVATSSEAAQRSESETRAELLTEGMLGGLQTPAQLADTYNKHWKKSVAEESRWDDRTGMGVVAGEAVRWRQLGQLAQKDKPSILAFGGIAASPPPAAKPAEVDAKADVKKDGEDRRKLGGINGRAASDELAQAKAVPGGMGFGYGGYGGGGGAGGVGGGAVADGRANNLQLPASANEPAAVANGSAPADGMALWMVPQGQVERYKEVGDKAATGKDAAGHARLDGFRPNDYFYTQPGGAAAAPDANQPAPPEQPGGGGAPQSAAGIKVLGDVAAVADSEGTPAAPEVQPAGQGVPASAGQSQPAPAPADPSPNAGRKIIRNGEMTFQVDGFDSAYVQITRIAAEEGGFVATTDSEKLANGKVKGTVTVRVPPDRLDTLVLKLRALGDLKSSRLAANDITKQYTDLESQLRASRAMEERLLNIIKTGKGEIKDLVEAEKQLGVYREKIEQVEGEIRYYNNLVSLSTLNVTLIERDIRTAAMLSETEQVNMGVESPDVEAARAAAIKAIEEAKGRIIESDLKKLEAGQFAGRIVADVPPDAAGPLIDRMKQIGTVARLEVSRKQAAPEGTIAPTPAQGGAGVRVERRETRFLISLYNLANVAPRQTTILNLAAEDVEQAYRTVLDQVKGAGGRIVTSQLNRPRPDQTTGTITFEAPAEGADVLLGAVRTAGEVMRLDVSQNPDAQNVTEAKRGFAVQIFSLASVAPRETTQLRVAARGVADSFNKLREAVRAAQGARVLSSQLKEDDPANVAGSLDFEVRRTDWAAVETALREAGHVVSRNVSRAADAENTVDTKVRLQVVLVDEAALQPRENVTVQLAVSDVPGQYAKLLEAAGAAQARVLQSQLTEQEAQQNVVGTLVLDVRRESRATLDQAMKDAGDVVSRAVARSTDTQNTLDDKVRLSLTLTDADKLPPRETTTLGIEVNDVEKAKEQIEALAQSLGGRVVDSTLAREPNGRVNGHVVADVPLGKSIEMVRRTREQGRVDARRDTRDETVPQGKLARARVDVALANEELIVEGGQGLWSRVREGLRTSVTGLLWSVQLIVIGLLLVAPWALIVYVGWRVIRRGRARRQTVAAPA